MSDAARQFTRAYLRANLLGQELELADPDVVFTMAELNYAWFELAGSIVHSAGRQTGLPLEYLVDRAIDAYDLGRSVYGDGT